MTTPIGFPPGTLYDILAITNEKPGIVTLDAVAKGGYFAIMPGQTVTISGVRGMVQVNLKRFIVGQFDPDAKTFALYDLQYNPFDTTGFPAYESGGEINIVSYPPGAGEPPGLMYNNQKS